LAQSCDYELQFPNSFNHHSALSTLCICIQDFTVAENAILARLGITDGNVDAARAALEASRNLHAITADLESTRSIVAEQAGRMMGVLTGARQAAIRAVAGDDPAAQLKAIQAIAPTWSSEDRAAAAAAAPPAPPAPPAPAANTAPPPTAPEGASPDSPPDHRATYESLSTNPFARAAYGMQHPEAYQPKRS